MHKHVTVVILSLCFLGSVFCKNVQVTELRVPSEAVLGDSVQLICRYELGNEELYVVKWYKDDLEFYRYEPKDKNQSVYFPQPGVDIDLSQSGKNSVFLRNVALDTAGIYKCQVSTDAPTYSCVQAVKEMDVIIMPQEGPTITGGEHGYDFGDNVTLNCTSSKSKPAAVLNWLVNGKVVSDEEITDHGVILENNNLQVASKSLNLHVTEDLFRRGKLSIHCEATFYGNRMVSGKQFTMLDNYKGTICSSSISILLSLIIVLWYSSR